MERESVSGKSASEKDAESVASSDYLHYDHTLTDSGGQEITPDNSGSGQDNYDTSGGSGDVIPLTSSGYPPYPHDHDVIEVGGKNLVRYPPAIYTKDNSKDVNPEWKFRQASENKRHVVPSSDQPHLVAVAPKSDMIEQQLQQSFTNPKMVDQNLDKYSLEDCHTSGSSPSQNSSGEDRYVSGREADGNNTQQNDTIPKINKVLETVARSNGFLQEDSGTSAQSEPSGFSSSDGNGYSPGHTQKGPLTLSGGECNGEDKDCMEWDSSDDEIRYTKQKESKIQNDLTKFVGEDFSEPEDDDDDETDPVAQKQEVDVIRSDESGTRHGFTNHKIADTVRPTDGDKHSFEDCNTSGSLESQNSPIENRCVPDRAAHGGNSPTKSQGNGRTNPNREDHVLKIPKVVANGDSYLREDSNTSDQSHLSTSSSSDGNGYAPVHMHMIPMASYNGECHEEDDGMEWDSSDDEKPYTKQKQSEIQMDLKKFVGEDFPVPRDDDCNDDE